MLSTCVCLQSCDVWLSLTTRRCVLWWTNLCQHGLLFCAISKMIVRIIAVMGDMEIIGVLALLCNRWYGRNMCFKVWYKLFDLFLAYFIYRERCTTQNQYGCVNVLKINVIVIVRKTQNVSYGRFHCAIDMQYELQV